MSIFLYGPPGSGKTTLGQALSQSLGLPFTDLDQVIAARAGATIPTLFEQLGEAGFRQHERAAILSRLNAPEEIVALGGGALLDYSCRERVEAAGPILCLHTRADILFQRLTADPTVRPLLVGDSPEEALPRLESLLARRKAHYNSFPLQLDTSDLTLEQASWEAQVQLGRFRVGGMETYEVRVQSGGLEKLGEALQGHSLGGPVALVSDKTVGKLYAERAAAALKQAGIPFRTILLSAGEQHKNPYAIISLWENFFAAGLERGSTVIGLGGGVVTDLAGFAAATYLRGVNWVAVPTSLLGMADASLGGKTGADLPHGKNLVGAFHAPRLVLADPLVLATLPEPEVRSGLAEVIKAGVISDPALFARCAQGWQSICSDWSEVIRRAMAVKIQVIQEDPYERGRRAALNLGHTIGHAVESTSGYRIRHGEAVAIGMVAEARLAQALGLAQPGLVEEITGALQSLGLPVEIPSELDRAAIFARLGADKKRASGRVRFALPRSIGDVVVGVEAPDALIQASLNRHA